MGHPSSMTQYGKFVSFIKRNNYRYCYTATHYSYYIHKNLPTLRYNRKKHKLFFKAGDKYINIQKTNIEDLRYLKKIMLDNGV